MDSKEQKIRLLVMDVDGTLTDGKLYYSEHGEAFKVFNAKDGYGIHEILPAKGIIPVMITGRNSAILSRRAHELGVELVFQGIVDKSRVVEDLIRQYVDSIEGIAYIGDDDNDLPAMNFAKLVGCPADASTKVIKRADFVSSQRGGDGAVRDFIEWLLENKYI